MKKSKILLVMAGIFALSSCVSTPSTSGENNEEIKNSEVVTAENNENAVSVNIEENKPGKLTAEDKDFIESLNNVYLNIVNAPREATIGNEFVRPFTISVKNGKGPDAAPIPAYPITIRYPSSKVDGELVYTTENVITDDQGIYVFTAPRTSFSAAGWFSAYPTYNSKLDNNELREEVKNIIADKSVNTQWLVKSDLAAKGGILVVWEFNERDRFQGNCSDLMSELRSRNIKNVTNAPYSDSSYIGQPMENVYRDNASLLADMELSYGYMIYGTIKFSKDVTPNEDGTYSCALVGDIQAINMKNGSVVMHKIFEQEATGKGWNDVVGRCKSKLMSKIVDSLLYEL